MSVAQPRARLLVVDDEPTQRQMLEAILGRSGFAVATAADGEQALELLSRDDFDLLLADQKMPKMDGLQLLDRVRRDHPSLPVVLMTAHGSVADAVAAMKQGAADYLSKPFEKEELVVVLDKALRQRRLEDEVATLRGVLKQRYRLGNIVGDSDAMQQVFSLIERVAQTDVPVLIGGESGTGKELVARAIHQHSSRSSRPFVALNCAAVPEGLMESEFFGHEKGSFTGAHRSHAGKFEQAKAGTLLLDEIGAMRVDLQAKLLRAIQEKEIQRVGGSGPVKVDVRIIAATCEDLEQSIRDRTFREDLYYRLNVVPIRLPALRERTSDIPLLAERFLASACKKFERPAIRIDAAATDRLLLHSWPGNVRELENCIERMVVLARSDRLGVDDLPPLVAEGATATAEGDGGFELPAAGVDLGRLERHLIEQAMARSQGQIGPAARLLGISYKTLQYRLRKHGL